MNCQGKHLCHCLRRPRGTTPAANGSGDGQARPTRPGQRHAGNDSGGKDHGGWSGIRLATVQRLDGPPTHFVERLVHRGHVHKARHERVVIAAETSSGTRSPRDRRASTQPKAMASLQPNGLGQRPPAVMLQPSLHRVAAALDAERCTNHVASGGLDACFGMRPQVAFDALIRHCETRRSVHMRRCPMSSNRRTIAQAPASLSVPMLATPLTGMSAYTDTSDVCGGNHVEPTCARLERPTSAHHSCGWWSGWRA